MRAIISRAGELKGGRHPLRIAARLLITLRDFAADPDENKSERRHDNNNGEAEQDRPFAAVSLNFSNGDAGADRNGQSDERHSGHFHETGKSFPLDWREILQRQTLVVRLSGQDTILIGRRFFATLLARD